MQTKRLAWLVIAVAIGSVLLAACGSDSDDKSSSENTGTNVMNETNIRTEPGEYQTLSIDEFADIVKNQADDYLIVNVHIPYAGEVENTDASIPYDDLAALIAAIPTKDTPVILYCRSGNMSKQASNALLEKGYTHVWDIPGGTAAWQASGRELIDK